MICFDSGHMKYEGTLAEGDSVVGGDVSSMAAVVPK